MNRGALHAGDFLASHEFGPGDVPVRIALPHARQRGERIAAKGIYREPVRSSRSHIVEASGLRWLSLCPLAPLPGPLGTVLPVARRHALLCTGREIDPQQILTWFIHRWQNEVTFEVVRAHHLDMET